MERLRRKFRILCVVFGLAVGIAGCVMYETAPGVYSAAPSSTFDRYWAAAVGAFGDEGVQIAKHDRSTGTISGHLGGTVATAEVLRRADGSVQVEFSVTGDIAANPSLKDRLVGSYSRRMGR